MIRRSTLVCGAAMALALPLTPWAASADDGTERETWGTCTGVGRWELSSETTRSGGVEVEFEIDGVPVGSQWSYTVTGPSGALATGTASADREGEVEITARTSGTTDDLFTALATSGDATCDSTVGAQLRDDDRDDDRDDSDDGADDHHDDFGAGSDDHYDDSGDHSDSDYDDDSGDGADPEDDDRDDDSHDRSGDDDGTVREGYCDGSSSLTVATSRRGRTTLTIDSGRRGQRWNYSLKQGKKTVKKGVGTTRRDGSLVVTTRKKVTTPRATAARLGGGERCATSRVS